MKKVSNSRIFSLLLRNTAIAVALSLAVHYLHKVRWASPDLSQPSEAECERIEALARSEPFATWASFYPYYLCEHSRAYTKLLHFIGSFNAICFLYLFAKGGMSQGKLVAAGVISAYGCAWIGDSFIEVNKPAMFKYPFFSFFSGWVMLVELLLGKLN